MKEREVFEMVDLQRKNIYLPKSFKTSDQGIQKQKR